ncbi:MAG: hypothetical protein NC432_07255 [Roseburia sp.]|nr:hypothetical protein [Roseburia sp.]MCM1098950.1 hypothetical protein [Ruminococcus flavefaciens]
MEKKIVCESCGGRFDRDLAKCPYCGSINIEGAEKEYMKKLEDVRGELEDLDELPKEKLREAAKKQGRRLRIILAAAAVIFAAATAVLCYINRPGDRDYKAEYLWQQEHYPQLDALYESGEYDRMLELTAELLEEENAILFEWKHYEFLRDYEIAKSTAEYFEAEELSDYSLQILFGCEWRLLGIALRRESYTEREYSALSPYVELATADLGTRWKLTEEEYADFYSELAASGNQYVPFEKIEAFIRKWRREGR